MLTEGYQCLESEEDLMPSKIGVLLKKHGISVRSVPTHEPGVYRLSLQVKGKPKIAAMFASMKPSEAKSRDKIFRDLFMDVSLDMIDNGVLKELAALVGI